MTQVLSLVVLLVLTGCSTPQVLRVAPPLSEPSAESMMPLADDLTLNGGITTEDLWNVRRHISSHARWLAGHCGYDCPINHVAKFEEASGPRLVALVGSCYFEFVPEPDGGWRLSNRGQVIVE